MSNAAEQQRAEWAAKMETRKASNMNKREAFAMAAMQGILAGLPQTADYSAVVTARQSVAHADALLAELNKEPTP